jgi:hypothetical protein
MNIRRHLTFNPRTDAGRRLFGLSKQLSKMLTEDDVRRPLATLGMGRTGVTRPVPSTRFVGYRTKRVDRILI